MRLVVTALGAMLLSAGPAVAGDWRLVQQTRNMMVAVDFDSVRINGDQRFVWSVVVLFEKDEELNYDYSLVRNEVDCRNDLSAIVSHSYYLMSGENVHSANARLETVSVIPGSVGESILKAACESERMMETSWADAATFAHDVREVVEQGRQ